MTIEQRDSIQQVLNTFRFHKLHKRPDWCLESVEKQITPLKLFQEYYEYYQQTKNLTVVSEKFGVRSDTLRKGFLRYNLDTFSKSPPRSRYRPGRQKPSVKTMDTLSLSQKEWNIKYSIKSRGLYYRRKKVATNFVTLNA